MPESMKINIKFYFLSEHLEKMNALEYFMKMIILNDFFKLFFFKCIMYQQPFNFENESGSRL